MPDRKQRAAQQGRVRIGLLIFLVLLLIVGGVTWMKTGPHTFAEPPLPPPAKLAANSKPNLLVIETDDLDQPVFDLMLKTGWLPNIQHGIVDKGVTFDNSFVTDSACCPSRATFLTGQYPKNHGILSVSKGAAYWYLATENREDRTLPVLVQQAGYFTGHIGKYLNGYGMFSSKEHLPKGYDEWYALVDPTTYDMYDYTVTLWKAAIGKTEVRDYHADHHSGTDYQTDKIADWALEFFDGAKASGKPFYLTLDPVAPHIETASFRDDPALGYRAVFRENIRPAPKFECLVSRFMPEYQPQETPGEWCSRKLPDSLEFLSKKPSFNELDKGKNPRLEKVLQKLTVENGDIGALERQHQFRMASMLSVDELVGRVLKKLDDTKMMQDTVIIFTSDNGYLFGEHGMNSKLLPYEESIRVPLVIRIPGNASGSHTPAIALNNDLAPTLADYAGAHVLRDEDAFDGRSLRPQATASTAPSTRKQFMVEHFIEATALELAAENRLFKDISEAATQFMGKLAGFEFGALGNLSYPAYKSIRREVDGDQWLYVQWYNELTNVEQVKDKSKWQIEFEELYDLGRDPYQKVNVIPLAEAGDDKSAAKALAKFRSDLETFKTCKADTCKAIEDQ